MSSLSLVDPEREGCHPVVESYPCPCCGHLTLGEPPGSYEICPVCFWEDDPVQLRWPTWAGGANKPSLIDAQRNFAAIGVFEERFHRHVRPPAQDEPYETGWRTIVDHDNFEAAGVKEADWPDDLTVLYWWRPTFWRSRLGVRVTWLPGCWIIGTMTAVVTFLGDMSGQDS